MQFVHMTLVRHKKCQEPVFYDPSRYQSLHIVTSAFSNTADMCKLSYKNKCIFKWNTCVFTDDAPVCKEFTVDLYLMLLFCLTCNHLPKLSENNSLVILCPTVLGAQLQFCPQTKPAHVSAPLFSLIGTRSVAARSWNTEPQSWTQNIIWWCHDDNAFTEWVEREANEMMSIELAYSKMSSGSFCVTDYCS